jgi:O-antigen/teichoic acid export membrane protein
MAHAGTAELQGQRFGWGIHAFARRAGISEDVASAQASTLLVLALRVAGAAAAYGAQVLTARFLGASEYGVFALLWVWIALIGQLAPLGFNQAVSRFAPRYIALSEPGLLRGFLFTSLLVVVATALAIFIPGAALIALLSAGLDPALITALTLGLLIIPFFSLQDLLENTARAFNWLTLAFVPPYLLRHSLVAMALVAAMFAGATANAATALTATLIAIAAASLVQGGIILLRLRKSLSTHAPQRRLREWLRCALPLVFVDGAHILFMNCDVLVLGCFVSSAELAIYFAATRLVQLAAYIPYAATAATSQRYAALEAVGRIAQLKTLVGQNALFTLGLSLACVLALLWTSPWLLTLFGGEFSAAVPLVAVLSFGVMAQVVAGPAEDLLNMLGKERTCAAVFAASVPLLLLLLLLLIPSYGAIGAAVATSLAMILRALALAWFVRRDLGISILTLRAAGGEP